MNEKVNEKVWPPKPFKIINFSNNCYINSVLQIFLNNEKLFRILYQNHFLEFNNQVVNPTKLLKVIENNINISNQNDAHEALSFILDKISKLNELIEGDIITHFQCNICKNKRSKSEKFIVLNIYNDDLEKNIIDFLKNEKFELDCEYCKKKTLTIKYNTIKKIGEMLIFYNILKLDLRISDTIIFNNYNYKLYGFIKHFGNSHSGHYTYIDYRKKLEISDQLVINLKKIDLKNIYLLVYQKSE